MKKSTISRLMVLLVGFVFLFTGCSSLDKARSLHNDGKDREALKMAAKYLEDSDEKVRLEAVNLVGEIGGDEAGRLLMPVLNDEDIEVKNAAIRNIGKIGYAPASKKLVDLSLTADGETLEEIAEAIRNIGAPAIDLLVKRFTKTTDPHKKKAYKRVMFEVGPSVATAISKTLAGKSYFENQATFELLVSFKNPMVATWMLKEIQNEEVADMVVEGLVKLGKNAVIPVMEMLTPLVGKPGDPSTKERLIRTLGDLKDPRAVPLLEKMSKDDNERISNAAEFSLRKIRGF